MNINGAEFIRRAKRYARKSGQTFRFEAREGKGSHGQLYVGAKRTMVKRSEIGEGLLNSMLTDLGIRKGDF